MRIKWALALASCAILCGHFQSALAQAAALVVKGDREFYTQGAFAAYASPWSADTIKSLRHLIDYEDTITIDPSRFPANTTIRSRWPTYLPSTGVWGYHHLSYGNYDGAIVQRPVLSRQVNDIKKLQINWGFTYSGSANFNLLNEFYLTSRQGDPGAKVIEIGIFQHVPPSTQRYVDLLPSVTYIDVWGRSWRMSRIVNFVMLTPTKPGDMLSASFDFRHLLSFLQARNVITGTEWFNGLGFGVEPTEGAGSTTVQIQKLQVEYY